MLKYTLINEVYCETLIFVHPYIFDFRAHLSVGQFLKIDIKIPEMVLQL